MTITHLIANDGRRTAAQPPSGDYLERVAGILLDGPGEVSVGKHIPALDGLTIRFPPVVVPGVMSWDIFASTLPITLSSLCFDKRLEPGAWKAVTDAYRDIGERIPDLFVGNPMNPNPPPLPWLTTIIVPRRHDIPAGMQDINRINEAVAHAAICAGITANKETDGNQL